MANDFARRVHDLVRSIHRDRFQEQIQAYLADRVTNRGQPFPLHRLDPDSDLDPDLETSRPVALADKYAALGAVHDLAYRDDGPLIPRSGPPTVEEQIQTYLGDGAVDSATVEGNWDSTLTHVADLLSKPSHLLPTFWAGLEDWFKDVAADLESLASERDSASASATASAAPPGRAPTKNQKPNVNARMIARMQEGADCHGWTITQWAIYLKCARSSVAETKTWKGLTIVREELKVQKQSDRRRNKRSLRNT